MLLRRCRSARASSSCALSRFDCLARLLYSHYYRARHPRHCCRSISKLPFLLFAEVQCWWLHPYRPPTIIAPAPKWGLEMTIDLINSGHLAGPAAVVIARQIIDSNKHMQKNSALIRDFEAKALRKR